MARIIKYINIYKLAGLLVLFPTLLFGQDLIVTSNGSILKAVIMEVTDDSISYKNAYSTEGFVFTVPQSDVKFIEYQNGEVVYFGGSYQNLSFNDTISSLHHIRFDDNTLLIDSVLITFQNLFSQQNIIFDFTNYADSTIIAEKGKVGFSFTNTRKDFTQNLYPTDDKIVFTKFAFNYPILKKHHGRLSEYKTIMITILIEERTIELTLSDDQSNKLMKIFSDNTLIE